MDLRGNEKESEDVAYGEESETRGREKEKKRNVRKLNQGISCKIEKLNYLFAFYFVTHFSSVCPFLLLLASCPVCSGRQNEEQNLESV